METTVLPILVGEAHRLAICLCLAASVCPDAELGWPLGSLGSNVIPLGQGQGQEMKGRTSLLFGP